MKLPVITITVLEKKLTEALSSMLENPDEISTSIINWNRNGLKQEILIKSISTGKRIKNIWKYSDNRLYILISSKPEETANKLWGSFPFKDDIEFETGVLVLSEELKSQDFSGWMFIPGINKKLTLSSIKIIGRGINKIYHTDTKKLKFLTDKMLYDPYIEAEKIIRYSRTTGALGENNWKKLISLKYAIIGAGRLGSLIFNSLVKSGANYISIIDPDKVEFYNIDASDCLTGESIGEYKVEALIRNLKKDPLYANYLASITPVPYLLNSHKALEVCRESDILICCTDQDFPRFSASFLGSVYLKPVLDIGTGIFYRADGKREMGADIRLLLPGNGCIQCMGGTAGNLTDSAILTNPEEEEYFMTNRNWSEERAGSLRSLNQIAAHTGLRLIEDFISERILTSKWVRVEFDNKGSMTARTIDERESKLSCLCRKIGEGDGVLSELSKKTWKKIIKSGEF